VAAFFDAGCSRQQPWPARPHAAALLTLAESESIDAVVVGEYERAFSGTQFQTMYTWFQRHGIQIWIPETAGPVDLHNPDHRTLMPLLGTQSQREVLCLVQSRLSS
jgi:site-specific DNA recombinase